MTPDQVAELQKVQRWLTYVLLGLATAALVFTATNVTFFATASGVSPAIAWLLDPMVSIALASMLVAEGVLAEYGIKPGGWASALRWFAGLATWLMNCWSSIWPAGTPWGVPRDVDPAGLVLTSVPPVLLILLAEATTSVRRQIARRIAADETPQGTPPAAPAAPLSQPGDAAPPPQPPAAPSLSPVAARAVIVESYVQGLSVREAAEAAGRAKSYVGRIYREIAREAAKVTGDTKDAQAVSA